MTTESNMTPSPADTAALVETAAQLAYERRIEWRMGAETARTAWVELDEFGKERERTCQRAALAVALSALAETQARLAAIVDCGDLVEQASRSGVVIAGPRADGYKLALGALGNAIEAARTSPPAAAAERGE